MAWKWYCDGCKKEMNPKEDERFRLHFMRNDEIKHNWELCSDCYGAIMMAVDDRISKMRPA